MSNIIHLISARTFPNFFPTIFEFRRNSDYRKGPPLSYFRTSRSGFDNYVSASRNSLQTGTHYDLMRNGWWGIST